MARKEKVFTLRIDAALLDYLKERADRNKRSIAKEIEYIVEELYLEESREFVKQAEIFLKTLKQENCSPEEFTKIITGKENNPTIEAAASSFFKFLNSRTSD